MQSIKELLLENERYLNKEVELCGWIKTIRKQKDYSFINIFDGSCFGIIQLVASSDLPNYENLVKQGTGLL